MVQVAQGAGAPQVHGGLAAPLPGTTYAGARWSTLAYVEKVRPQVLSLRQVAQDGVFSGQIRWQISPVAVEISNLELWTPSRQNRPIVLRKAGFSPNLRTPLIRYGSRNSIVSNYL